MKYVSYGGAPVRDESGQIVLGIVTSRDITAQKEAEEDRERLMLELQQERGRLQEALKLTRASARPRCQRCWLYHTMLLPSSTWSHC